MELNTDQLRIVNSRPNGHILIKGVAGSGKTTVAVSKIPMLINQYMDTDDKILFVTYNKTLINYTEHLIQSNNIKQDIVFNFNPEKQLYIKTIDSIITGYASRLRSGFSLAGTSEQKAILSAAIYHASKKYPDIELISENYSSFLKEEIDWIKSCRYVERETYLNIDRLGRMSVGSNRFRLNKNSPERNAIFDIFMLYEKILADKKLTDFKTNALIVLEGFNSGKLTHESYRHIIVDESQDLTRVQLEIIKHLYKAASADSGIIFIADAAQSIYTQSWLSAQSFRSIGFDMSGKSNILSKNYRTTYEIAQAAYSLIENDEVLSQSDMFVKPVAIDRHGDAPFYMHYSSQAGEAYAIAKQIKSLSGRYELKDIVIAAANSIYLTHIKDILINNGVDAEIFTKAEIDFSQQTVRLFTLHSIKGLEFPVLFIAGINEGVLPLSESQISIGRKLLYVGMTRARQELYLSSAIKASVFMNEINQKLLRNSSNGISSFYRVNIENYRFSDRLVNENSREEMVRQWFINELITKLNYPEKNIDIEFPVQSFSRRGFADIVVFQYKNGQKTPYILAEIKQPGEDMDRALKQLFDYSHCCPQLEYIVVTDGFDTSIINVKNGNNSPSASLPVYTANESNLYTSYKYVDYEKHNYFHYDINAEDCNEIVIRNYSTDEVVDCSAFYSLNVIGEVAAGNLKVANETILGHFRLPAVFGIYGNDCFILKVNGDSMINFGIDNGDYVVIHCQKHAFNGDIVVAGILGTDEVTLKQYCNFSGNVGLTPGNPNYKPILVPENELFINGVLKGILKPE